jgi:glucose-6-phosphate 1-dehydrogenase
VTNPSSYLELNDLLTKLDSTYQTEGNRIFYLAMAPEFFGTIAQNLKKEGLTATNGWSRLVIEKPFGHDLPSAQKLNQNTRSL